MRYWFTSDLHIGHENIIKYTKRPYKTVEEMNYKLVKNWNEIVDVEDTVIHIGDFTSSYEKVNTQKWVDKLNGNIIFIKGNHDRGERFKIEDLMFIIGAKHVHCTHHPEMAAHEYNLVGHVHEKWKTKIEKDKQNRKKYMINVGVDVWNYRPITVKTINELFEEMKRNENK